ncbi:MAG: helix-turn-helix domain-containing protein [Rhodobacteraceae bacterium]|nr:helix-turn-helix domain-containing protein [Paracoccaceae bacterium]
MLRGLNQRHSPRSSRSFSTKLAEVARKSNVSYEALKKIKQRKTTSPSAESASAIAKAFGMSFDEFHSLPGTAGPPPRAGALPPPAAGNCPQHRAMSSIFPTPWTARKNSKAPPTS